MSSGSAEKIATTRAQDCSKRERNQPKWLPFLPAMAIGLTLLVFRIKIFLVPLPLDDFIYFWTGARQFVTHANPYSLPAMAAMQRGMGLKLPVTPLLYPPWALLFMGWFGLFPFAAAHAVWRFVIVAIEGVGAVTLWCYFGGSTRTAWLALALLVTFLPAGFAEQMGQITPLMLGGITLFLLLIRDNRFVLAGVSVLLLGLKPHLVYLLLAAVVLWALQERRWRLLTGAAFAYAASTLAVVAFNPRVLSYLRGSPQAAIETVCGVGGLLRVAFGMEHRWLQFVPTALGLAWFSVHWRRYRRTWMWQEQTPLLLLVSLATAPYSWAHDYVLAMPAMLALAVRLSRSTSDWLLPSALYLGVQYLIFSTFEIFGKPWQSAASLLWLALYIAGSRSSVRVEAELASTVAS